jgi:hypothetical protein
MVTVALMVLIGAVGLVVDIGLAYYYRRAAQVAADAAAQAGAKRALELATTLGSFGALGSDNADVEDKARTYAALNAFTQGGQAGRQTVTVRSGPAASAPPDLAGLQILYWVEVICRTRVASLFIRTSGAGGEIDSPARAVAAVLLGPVTGQVLLLNQTCDPDGANCGPGDAPAGETSLRGINLDMSGGPTLNAPGGISMNSSANADGIDGRPDDYAAERNGNGTVTAGFVQIAQDGEYQGQPQPNFIPGYTNGPQVPDPTLSMNFGRQPRVLTVSELVARTPGNVVYGVTAELGDGGAPALLPPGVYVRGYTSDGGKKFNFSNLPVSLKNVQFVNPTGQPGTWIFLGGLEMEKATVDFYNGTVVAAGAPTGTVLDVDRSFVSDTGTYGELILTTRPDYTPQSGPPSPDNPILLDAALASSYWIQPLASTGGPIGIPAQAGPVEWNRAAGWGFGDVNWKGGTGNNATDLIGLRNRPACEPGQCASPVADPINNEYYLYQSALLWQDRRNAFLSSSRITADANALSGMAGLIYQPRGSLLDINAGGNNEGTYQLITGAIALSGNGTLNMVPTVPVPALQTIVSLVR